jgi:transposase
VRRRWPRGPIRARGLGSASSSGPNWLQLLTQDPTEHGCPTSLWTGRRVVELIRRHFAVLYHPMYVLRLLRAMGLSRQKPQPCARERDEAAIAHWRRYRWPALKKKRTGSAVGRYF